MNDPSFTDPLIRAYRPSDKPVLLDIMRRNTPAFFAESELTDFENYLEDHLEKYFVIISERIVAGAGGINFSPENKTATISWDMIHPESHGKKLGQKLLQYRLSLLKSAGDVEKVIVRTSQLAFGFYEKNGFNLEKTVKDYWAEGFDLYFMTYDLSRNI